MEIDQTSRLPRGYWAGDEGRGISLEEPPLPPLSDRATREAFVRVLCKSAKVPLPRALSPLYGEDPEEALVLEKARVYAVLARGSEKSRKRFFADADCKRILAKHIDEEMLCIAATSMSLEWFRALLVLRPVYSDVPLQWAISTDCPDFLETAFFGTGVVCHVRDIAPLLGHAIYLQRTKCIEWFRAHAETWMSGEYGISPEVWEREVLPATEPKTRQAGVGHRDLREQRPKSVPWWLTGMDFEYPSVLSAVLEGHHLHGPQYWSHGDLMLCDFGLFPETARGSVSDLKKLLETSAQAAPEGLLNFRDFAPSFNIDASFHLCKHMCFGAPLSGSFRLEKHVELLALPDLAPFVRISPDRLVMREMCAKGEYKAMHAMISNDSQLQKNTPARDACLMAAASGGHRDIVQLFSFDINDTPSAPLLDFDDACALCPVAYSADDVPLRFPCGHWSCESCALKATRGHTLIAECIQCKQDVPVKGGLSEPGLIARAMLGAPLGERLLIAAVVNNHPSVINLLLDELGVPLTVTVAAAAAAAGRVAVVRAFLSSGTQAGILSHFASRYDHAECIRAVVELSPEPPRHGPVAVALVLGNMRALSALEYSDMPPLYDSMFPEYAIASNSPSAIAWAARHGVQFCDSHCDIAFRHGKMEAYLALLSRGFSSHVCTHAGHPTGGERLLLDW